MNRQTLYKLHRWIFIFMGVFMVTWLLSGIIMAMPGYWFGPASNHKNPDIDYRVATLSPAEAINRLVAQGVPNSDIKQVSLRQVNEDLLYSIRLADGSNQLINARNGAPFAFSEQMVVDIIRKAFKVESPVQEVTRLLQHDKTYPWGSLPAWRIRFEYNPSHAYLLEENNLGIFRSSIETRIRTAIMSLHDFSPLDLISNDDRIRMGLLIVIGSISLLGALIGLLLALPRKRVQH